MGVQSSGPAIGSESVSIKIEFGGRRCTEGYGLFQFRTPLSLQSAVLPAIGYSMVMFEGHIMAQCKFCTCQYMMILTLCE